MLIIVAHSDVESDMFQLVCCTNGREFVMHVVDNQGRVMEK